MEKNPVWNFAEWDTEGLYAIGSIKYLILSGETTSHA